MTTGLIIFLIIIGFAASGAAIVYRDSKRSLPKNLPPPLKEETKE